MTPVFILFLPSFFSAIKFLIPFILIFSSFYLIFTEEEFIISILIFLLAGFLGLATFNLPIQQPLLPLLTGLFGASSLVISLKQKTAIPKQKIIPIKKTIIPKLEFIKSSIAALIAAPLCSFLPAIGSSQAAILGSQFFKQNDKTFLFIVGAVNVSVMSLSFVTAYAINKTRTGSAVAIQQLLNKITPSNLIIILASIILVGIIAFLLAIQISKVFTKIINKVNYNYISITVISILLIVNIIFTNWLGLIVLTTATALGVFCILSESRRINMMGCLIIPSIVYFLTN
jgi:putative membrane protein